jgi:agmatinase
MTSHTNGFAIICLPYERTTSFLKGTRFAPEVIVDELTRMDGFDYNLGYNPLAETPAIISTPHDTDLTDPLVQQTIAATAVNEMLEDNRFVISIGGEHTVTLGPLMAVTSRGAAGVVQLDAHGDLRYSYEDSIYSHACVMRRIHEMGCPALGIGIRTICKEESEFIKKTGLNIVHAARVIKDKSWYSLIDTLPDRIYLTIDMDFFDSSAVPALGTPETGGPSWEDAVDFITFLFSHKTVEAADIVEMKPGINDAASVRLAARLIALLISLAQQ